MDTLQKNSSWEQCIPHDLPMAQLERAHILNVLKWYKDNKILAAIFLDIYHQVLVTKLQTYRDEGYSLPESKSAWENMIPENTPMKDLERVLILKTLERYKGNRVLTYKVLGITIFTLKSRLRRYLSEGYEVPLSDPRFWGSIELPARLTTELRHKFNKTPRFPDCA